MGAAWRALGAWRVSKACPAWRARRCLRSYWDLGSWNTRPTNVIISLSSEPEPFVIDAGRVIGGGGDGASSQDSGARFVGLCGGGVGSWCRGYIVVQAVEGEAQHL